MLKLARQKLLVIAPHPDDEVLGCGGLIKRIKDEGGKVYVLFLTVGNTEDFSKAGFSTEDERIEEIKKVADFMHFDGWDIAFRGDRYHLKLDAIPKKDIIHAIERGKKISLESICPTIIATPQIIDYNQDHKAATESVFAATRPAPSMGKKKLNFIVGYESVPAEWSTTAPGSPNLFVKLTKTDVEAKVDAFKLYRSQVRMGPHLRAVETVRSLARFRGAQCAARYAEAHYLYKCIF